MDEITFAPPDDNQFQLLLARAMKGELPVYGVVLETAQIQLRRAFPLHRPELTRDGAEMIARMARGWNAGQAVQPWLYVHGSDYIVADDYFWLALIEKFGVESFAAQCIGEPVTKGLVQKVGPLQRSQILNLLGLASE